MNLSTDSQEAHFWNHCPRTNVFPKGQSIILEVMSAQKNGPFPRKKVFPQVQSNFIVVTSAQKNSPLPTVCRWYHFLFV
jgi:hypothetical protein